MQILKNLATLLVILLLSACSDDTSQKEQGNDSDETSGVSSEYYQLNVERGKVIKELKSLMKSNNLSAQDSPEYVAVNKEFTSARLELAKLRKNHPDLKELNQKEREAMDILIKASGSGKDTEKEEKASKNAIEALHTKAKTIPEIQAQSKKVAQLAYKRKVLQYSPVASLPEGKKLLQRLDEIDRKLGKK